MICRPLWQITPHSTRPPPVACPHRARRPEMPHSTPPPPPRHGNRRRPSRQPDRTEAPPMNPPITTMRAYTTPWMSHSNLLENVRMRTGLPEALRPDGQRPLAVSQLLRVRLSRRCFSGPTRRTGQKTRASECTAMKEARWHWHASTVRQLYGSRRWPDVHWPSDEVDGRLPARWSRLRNAGRSMEGARTCLRPVPHR